MIIIIDNQFVSSDGATVGSIEVIDGVKRFIPEGDPLSALDLRKVLEALES